MPEPTIQAQILAELARVWSLNDALRLGQLLTHFSGSRDLFYVDDEDLLHALRAHKPDLLGVAIRKAPDAP